MNAAHFARQRALQRRQISEWHTSRILKQRSKTFAPERIVHQRQSASRQAVKTVLGVNNGGAAGGGPGELDGGLDSFATAAAEINFL